MLADHNLTQPVTEHTIQRKSTRLKLYLVSRIMILFTLKWVLNLKYCLKSQGSCQCIEKLTGMHYHATWAHFRKHSWEIMSQSQSTNYGCALRLHSRKALTNLSLRKLSAVSHLFHGWLRNYGVTLEKETASFRSTRKTEPLKTGRFLSKWGTR